MRFSIDRILDSRISNMDPTLEYAFQVALAATLEELELKALA